MTSLEEAGGLPPLSAICVAVLLQLRQVRASATASEIHQRPVPDP